MPPGSPHQRPCSKTLPTGGPKPRPISQADVESVGKAHIVYSSALLVKLFATYSCKKKGHFSSQCFS